MSDTEESTHMVKSISDSSFKSIKMDEESESDITLKEEEKVKTGFFPYFSSRCTHDRRHQTQKKHLSSDSRSHSDVDALKTMQDTISEMMKMVGSVLTARRDQVGQLDSREEKYQDTDRLVNKKCQQSFINSIASSNASNNNGGAGGLNSSSQGTSSSSNGEHHVSLYPLCGKHFQMWKSLVVLMMLLGLKIGKEDLNSYVR